MGNWLNFALYATIFFSCMLAMAFIGPVLAVIFYALYYVLTSF